MCAPSERTFVRKHDRSDTAVTVRYLPSAPHEFVTISAIVHHRDRACTNCAWSFSGISARNPANATLASASRRHPSLLSGASLGKLRRLVSNSENRARVCPLAGENFFFPSTDGRNPRVKSRAAQFLLLADSSDPLSIPPAPPLYPLRQGVEFSRGESRVARRNAHAFRV